MSSLLKALRAAARTERRRAQKAASPNEAKAHEVAAGLLWVSAIGAETEGAAAVEDVLDQVEADAAFEEERAGSLAAAPSLRAAAALRRVLESLASAADSGTGETG